MVTRKPRRGDRVVVAWGLDDVDGVVVDIYGSGRAQRGMVRVQVLGPSGEEPGESTVIPVTLGAIEGILV
jgi:hypothetical protein